MHIYEIISNLKVLCSDFQDQDFVICKTKLHVANTIHFPKKTDNMTKNPPGGGVM